ncbi:MAG: hydroxyethylthiazole kinase [Kiritimatiellae bacterium]|nr:hydroxyethylthiazole kinase [Kiritimatiellia bacterium]MCO5068248.1 hydroxyethylthiazole kinase [Kiritimatiellia bacterium]
MGQGTSNAERVARNWARVVERSPLVHNITNYVTVNFVANVLLALGASPVMAHAENEVEEMVALAGALALNIGTLDDAWVASMLKAGRKARELNVPVILDPVGAGATKLRTDASMRILRDVGVTILRGNASEIRAVVGASSSTRGVDSTDAVSSVSEQAKRLAREQKLVVAVTGENDYVTDGTREVWIGNGHPLMKRVTGMGCALTAVVGAFAAVEEDPFWASASALACYGVAGEVAAEGDPEAGTYAVRFLDALMAMDRERILRHVRLG